MNRSSPLAAVLLSALLSSSAGCATAAGPRPPAAGESASAPSNPALADLDATLWTQLSAEYRGAAIQAYRTARRQLRHALRDSSWSAAREQRKPFRDKPPAVILDVDETVLDNSPYQARLLRRGETFSSDSWDAWVDEARAPAVPGALSFARFAHRNGVRVFYVTNRNADQEGPTRRNLERLGFPLADTVDALLTERERTGWDGTKVSRRRHVARGHRILLLVGDNLGDFTDDPQPGRWVRERAAVRPGGEPASRPRRGDRWWGRRWVVIPNPVYGSWEEAALEGASDLPPGEQVLHKVERTVPLNADGGGSDGGR